MKSTTAELPTGQKNAGLSMNSQLSPPASFFESQIFKLEDDGTGKARHFSIAPMVDFATRNLPVEAIKADPKRAGKMVESGSVNAEYVVYLTGRNDLAPIVLCLGAGKDGGDLIVDGNHRYVAWTLALHERGGAMIVPGFRLQREQWEQFVVPDDAVAQMCLLDPCREGLASRT